jgi:hypothetical protein
MPNLDGMNMKFVLFKKEDVHKYLDGDEYEQFLSLQDSIYLGLLRDKKNTDKTYLVINTDEPYADEVIEIMKRYGHWG